MKIGIIGYGNLGRSLEMLVSGVEDAEIKAVFTRRPPSEVKTLGADVVALDSVKEYRSDIDVACLCQGSSEDLPRFASELAAAFNTVDSYDNHKAISEYRSRLDTAAKSGGHTSLIGMGWDPGLLSLIRLYSNAFIPNASVNTFWGRGVSQGHSEAIRRINGVKKAVQYTVPREDALTLAGLISHPFSDTDRHRRVCYVVAEKEKEDLISYEILSMENYFQGYETEIHFISESEFDRCHGTNSHRGRVYALGSSGRYREKKHSMFLDLEIGSNPDFTASVMLASARAAHLLNKEGYIGAYSIFDVPPRYFAPIKCENVNNYL